MVPGGGREAPSTAHRPELPLQGGTSQHQATCPSPPPPQNPSLEQGPAGLGESHWAPVV